VARTLLGFPGKTLTAKCSPQEVIDLFRAKGRVRPWFLSEEFWHSLPSSDEAVNGDIEKSFRRLLTRGVSRPDRLLEAFLGEYRMALLFNPQLLSCRIQLDIAMPFADRDFLLLASRIPIGTKIHNRLNRRMLQRHASSLLRFPTAATLVPAWSPIFLQEVSRLMRSTVFGTLWRLHTMSRGAFDHPHLSWINFDFLRSGKALRAVEDNLRSPLWHREAIADRIDGVIRRKRSEPAAYVHYIASQMLTIYSVDRMLR
jgi:hypothetical protein